MKKWYKLERVVLSPSPLSKVKGLRDAWRDDILQGRDAHVWSHKPGEGAQINIKCYVIINTSIKIITLIVFSLYDT